MPFLPPNQQRQSTEGTQASLIFGKYNTDIQTSLSGYCLSG